MPPARQERLFYLHNPENTYILNRVMLLYKHVALKFEALRIMFLNHVILRFFFTDVFFNSPLMYKKKNVYFTLK